MSTTYEEVKSLIEKHKCKCCKGFGKVDDAEPGDIWFNEFVCECCEGSGHDKELEGDINRWLAGRS